MWNGAPRGVVAPTPRCGRAAIGYARRAVDADKLLQRYEAAFEGLEAPFAYVDLDAMGANASAMLDRAAGKPIRIASKSVRCRDLLERVGELDDRFRGLRRRSVVHGDVVVGSERERDRSPDASTRASDENSHVRVGCITA